MNILLLGSSGVLGKELYKNIKSIQNVKIFHNGLLKKKYDLLNVRRLEKTIKDSKPNLIINASAISDIDICEKNKKKTYKINVGLVNNIFNIKKKNKLKFFFFQFSTDQIYDSKKITPNKENCKLKINNEYSKQKIHLEKICKKNKSTIFRINFFGKNNKKKSITDWIFYSFKKKRKINLFKDVYFNPLRIDTLCKIIKKIIISKKYHFIGTFNLGSKQFMSKSDFAIYFAKKSKIYNSNYVLKKVDACLKTKRSKNMIMDVNKFEKKFKIKLPKIKDEISVESKKYLND
jgi:dTDP-4-dehydrorhamnose reductase